MTTMKTSELYGAALNWAVAKCECILAGELPLGDRKDVREGITTYAVINPMFYNPSANWAQGGPIIEREKITFYLVDIAPDFWAANLSSPWKKLKSVFCMHGDTPLIAAMRCYVASKLGDTVAIPEELTK